VNNTRRPGFPALPQPPVFHQPGQVLPSLQPPYWPGGGFDPRAYQPGFDPGHPPDNSANSNPFTGFDFLSLGSKNECVISFGADLQKNIQPKDQPPKPSPWTLTLVPCQDDLTPYIAVGGTVDFYYKIDYVFDGRYPSYAEGSFNRSGGGGAGQGFSPLPIRGIKLQLSTWAIRITIKGVGTGSLANWQTVNGPGNPPLTVRFDAFVTPSGQQVGLGGNVITRRITDPNSILPEFSYSVSVPAPAGFVGGFTFVNLNEVGIVSYPANGLEIPIPPDAIEILGDPSLFCLFRLY
jgi:hypothetical protein